MIINIINIIGQITACVIVTLETNRSYRGDPNTCTITWLNENTRIRTHVNCLHGNTCTCVHVHVDFTMLMCGYIYLERSLPTLLQVSSSVKLSP